MPLITTNKPRVLYLDVDDTLLIWQRTTDGTDGVSGFAAPRAAEFIRWAVEHFEVRWLTMWCPPGTLDQHSADELEYRFNKRISAQEFMAIRNPMKFEAGLKTDAIDFDDPLPWVWVEDDIMLTEEQLLRRKHLYDNFYPTNVSIDPTRLQLTWQKLAHRFMLPDAPSIITTEVDHPPTAVLTEVEIMKMFRPKMRIL